MMAIICFDLIPEALEISSIFAVLLGIIFGIIIGLMSLYFSPRADFVFDKYGSTYAYKNHQGKLVASRYHKNKFLEKMWTGQKTKGKYKVPEKDALTCDKESCTYAERIKFSKGKVEFDGKEIALKAGGFINLQNGIYYYYPETGRLWNKQTKQ